MGVTIEWQKQDWLLLPQRALLWRNRRVLILSDLHLGKAHDFQAAGIPIPNSVHFEDLGRLENLLHGHQPEQVFILGDFVHSNRNSHPELAAEFNRIRGAARFVLALGNHDRGAEEKLKEWKFDAIVRDIQQDGITFCHDERGVQGASVNGHVHPVVRLGSGRDRLRLPCFVAGRERFLLPSFGAFTGGFEITRRRGERVYAVADESVVDVSEGVQEPYELVTSVRLR